MESGEMAVGDTKDSLDILYPTHFIPRGPVGAQGVRYGRVWPKRGGVGAFCVKFLLCC